MANSHRQKEWPGHQETDVAFKAIEFAGETGELMEAIKKFLRVERGIMGSTATKQDIADEMGDVLISLDLLAAAMGIDLSEAVRSKFNATSEKYHINIFIDAEGQAFRIKDGL